MADNKLVKLFEESISKNWDLPALTNYKKDSLKYSEIAQRISWIHHLYTKLGIKKGDKIALIGRNLNTWGISYIATITYGAVIVPILPDFNSTDIYHIANHSESILLFSTENIFNKIDDEKIDKLKGVISLVDFSALSDKRGKLSKAMDYADKMLAANPVNKNNIRYTHISDDDMSVLSYTSGSSGFSKGVMLPGRSLYSNIVFAVEFMGLTNKDKVVSFLPLAHVFGCAFEFLAEFCIGAEVVFLSRVPSPQVITKAFRDVKPRMVFTVPLILEKIYKKKILPVLSKTSIQLMLKIPMLERKVYAKILEELTDTFGGNFTQICIGGAALSAEVEEFLMKIGFPITIGYGMTECAPLVTYTNSNDHKLLSCGKIVDRMEVKIYSDDPQNIPGEVWVKGMNVMLGYYKNKEATKEIFDKKGWMNTGDMGIIDADGHLFLRGRSKNMLLGPSGQNIYPEEIETKLNNMPYVLESVVTDDENNKLVALAYPDYESLDPNNKANESEILEIFEKNRKKINKELPGYMQLSRIQLYPEEFKKTPKRNIKRYLYTNILK
ncbi:MAG: AMP-binding protein [Marinifilaceae bacterium]